MSHSRLRASPRGLLFVVLVSSVIAACSGRPTTAPPGQRSVITPERSARGNPPFYEVDGERYYVLDSSDGYRERGVASWYGRDFNGRPTSSGEIYDMNEMTAAHKTLPIPTWVEVTNLTNGRSVIVKVNDRGPFVDGRIIDLSRQAASELGMIETGTARVQLRALGAAAIEPSEDSDRRGFSIISEARADSVGPGDRPFRPVYVQVGAFANRDNAAGLVRKLEDGGFDNSFVLTSGRGKDRLHRVRIGPIEPNEYDRVRADLVAIGVYDSSLIQEN